ncbi:MAG: RNA-binding protein [Lentisphaeraceae bacterium]|nr:RNA-binding protein [Lentisphaeraceae bacterium]
MKILVRNFDRETDEETLKSWFVPFGRVDSCKVIMDEHSNLSKGFAFVVMPKPYEAKAAIKALNGTSQNGYTIRVKKAQPKKSTPAPKEK